MLGVIMLLAMVFDLAERLSEFIENQAPVSEIITGYYLNFILFYGNTFSSLIIFIAVIWFTAKMAQETEIIPLLFMGRPFIRVLRPYMIAATFLTLVSLVLNHFIIPRSNRVRLEFEEKFYRNDLVVEDYHAEFPGKEYIHFSNYVASTHSLNEFVIEKYNEKNELIRLIKARTAQAKPGSNKWRLIDSYERIITPPKSVKTPAGEDAMEFTNDVLVERKFKDTVFNFIIENLAQRDNIAEAMTYTELVNFIQSEKEKGNPSVPSFEIELYQRTSYPFATYVLTIIAVSVASRKKRGGIGINIAIGFIFVFIYIFAMKVTTVAAIKVGFPPMAAVWIPNIIFGVIAYFMYRLAPK